MAISESLMILMKIIFILPLIQDHAMMQMFLGNRNFKESNLWKVKLVATGEPCRTLHEAGPFYLTV